MNDQDLERELRSQQGPREDGYTPSRLPMTLEDGSARRPRASILPRAAMFAGVALAGALAVAVVTGIFSGSNPDVGSNDSASPSAQASAAAPGNCAPADVSFSAEPWGGEAGSRGTVVTVTLADGRDECLLSTAVGGEIQDADGTVLVNSLVLGVGGRQVRLEPGAAYTIGVSWSNWCGGTPAAPVTVLLRAEGWPGFVPVTTPAGGDDPVPPCMGSTQSSSLSVTAVQPAS